MNWIRKINPSVRCAGQGNWKKDFVEPLRQIYDHELVIFEKGSCEIEIGLYKYKFQPDSWVIIPPGISHRSRAVTDGVLRHWVHFDWIDKNYLSEIPICKYSPQTAEDSLLRRPPAFMPETILKGSLSGTDADLIYSLAASLEQRLQHSSLCERLTSKAVFLEMLIRLLNGKSSAEEQHFRQNTNSDAFSVKMLLDQMPATETSVRELIASSGKSYEHLCRRFHEEYGLAPVEYLNKLRIEMSKKFLLSNTMNISEIAEKCGYSSAGYFCRVFRKNTGQSPLSYRKKVSGNG